MWHLLPCAFIRSLCRPESDIVVSIAGRTYIRLVRLSSGKRRWHVLVPRVRSMSRGRTSHLLLLLGPGGAIEKRGRRRSQIANPSHRATGAEITISYGHDWVALVSSRPPFPSSRRSKTPTRGRATALHLLLLLPEEVPDRRSFDGGRGGGHGPHGDGGGGGQRLRIIEKLALEPNR